MKQTLIFDCEVYKNYFLVAFRNVATGKVRTFEMYDGNPIDAVTLRKVLETYTLVSFNGNHYDVPMLSMALAGKTCADLKALSNDIIETGLKPWVALKGYGVKQIEGLDHIDLIEVAPGTASLKIYGGRLHTRRMQDLPIDNNALITPAQREELRTYCVNDLQVTFDLYNELKPQLELREHMSAEYCIDLRSKSDAQIAEAVIRDGVGTLLERSIKPPVIPPGTEFNYRVPDFIRGKTPIIRDLIEEIAETAFEVAPAGNVELPKNLKNRAIRIGNGEYRMGIGGLHSSEKSVAHYSDDTWQLVDRDVTSYYPMIILNQRLFPKHMGEAFLKVYKQIVDRRVAAKKSGDKVTDAALKITINGSFGKFGSKYSALYSPELLIQTTITGQLSLLMLIEALEDAWIPVVSANTDGLVIKVPRERWHIYEEVVRAWESQTNFSTEANNYDALYSRDVNNYLAIKEGGKGYKAKGVYAPAMLMKNPVNQVCVDAVVGLLLRGTPVRDTIESCEDMRKFVTIRQVKGGAVHRGQYLGRAVRWYYSTSCRGETINYKINGNTVARSDGAMPMMEMLGSVPLDLDVEWYVRESYDMLVDMGAV